LARPREDAKRSELANRAVAVLEREGLGISTEQLARELGVKRPTLLYHFPTYAEALETVLVSLLAEQMEFVSARVEKHEHPIDRMYARLVAIAEFHRGREARILFLSQAIAALGGARAVEIMQRASDFFEADRAAMVARVEAGIAAGIVEPCDANALVGMLRALIDGLTIQRVTTHHALEPVYQLVWERVLLPLKRTSPRTSKRKTSS
jgi:AcrR family transcriptional regulator